MNGFGLVSMSELGLALCLCGPFALPSILEFKAPMSTYKPSLYSGLVPCSLPSSDVVVIMEWRFYIHPNHLVHEAEPATIKQQNK